MLGQIVHVAVRVLVGMASGTLLGALYAGLVGAVHLGVGGRWDHVPAFAAGCVLAGAVLGLVGGVAWALWGRTHAKVQTVGCRPQPPRGILADQFPRAEKASA
jgi:hypothetical protein